MLDQKIRVFLSVCEHGTMTEAARSLYMTQPAVSQTIAALEEQYQTKLFDRFPRRLQLTEAGKVLKDSAQDMVRMSAQLLLNLRMSEEIEEKLRRQDEEAPVRIGVNLSVGKALIHDYLKIFRNDHPKTPVRVNATRGSILRGMLQAGEMDFLLMEDPDDDDFIKEPFYHDRIVITAPPGHPVFEKCSGNGQGIRLADLAREDLFLREKGAGVREQFDHLCQAHALKIEPAWESSSTSILVGALLSGERGIAVLPYLLVRDELAAGKLREVPVSDVRLDRILFIVRHRGRHLTKAAQDFLEIIRNRVR